MSRLIDADALMDKISVFLERNEDLIDPSVADCIEEIIEQDESVDAVEVVHGEWIKEDDFDELIKGSVICSNCGGRYQSLIVRNNEIEVRANKTPYCPNCGAKMDGEVKSDG